MLAPNGRLRYTFTYMIYSALDHAQKFYGVHYIPVSSDMPPADLLDHFTTASDSVIHGNIQAFQ